MRGTVRDDVSNMVDSQQKFSSRTQREMGETKKMVKKVEGMTRKVVFNTSSQGHCKSPPSF